MVTAKHSIKGARDQPRYLKVRNLLREGKTTAFLTHYKRQEGCFFFPLPPMAARRNPEEDTKASFSTVSKF